MMMVGVNMTAAYVAFSCLFEVAAMMMNLKTYDYLGELCVASEHHLSGNISIV